NAATAVRDRFGKVLPRSPGPGFQRATPAHRPIAPRAGLRFALRKLRARKSLRARKTTLRDMCALALQIERHCSADEVLQCRLIHLFAFVNVDRAPDIPFKAGVEQA